MDAFKVQKTFLDILADILGVCLIMAMGMGILFIGAYFA